MSTSIKLTLAAAGMLLATLTTALAAPVSITGEVTYRERIALPPDSSLEIQLLDVSLADAKATVHAAARLSGPGQVPLTFTLNFDDKVIKPKHTYALSARITSRGKLLFLNTTQYSVDPLAPAQPIMIIMDFVGRAEPAPLPGKEAAIPPASIPATQLIGTNWRVVDIKGTPTNEKTRTTLTLAEDGRAGGKGGCNSYFAQATINGGSLVFGSPASTRMACPEPMMQQEASFFSAMAVVATYAIDGNNLRLADANGNPVMNLVKDN